MLQAPIRLASRLLPKVWGGRRLVTVLGKDYAGEDPLGEAWEVSDHASHASQVLSETLAGLTLRDLMRTRASELLGYGSRHKIFPLLVKFLDANDWLSVQVHPDDEKVKKLSPGEGGKTEAWFVLQADPGSRIYAGLQPGVTADQLHSALVRGTVTECLHHFAPEPGDCLFLPAGTVHAVGGGVLMAEVQQTSDATFRLYDWDRRDSQGRARPLHIEQALACIDWDQGPVLPKKAHNYPTIDQEGLHRESLVECKHFRIEDVRGTGPFSLATQDHCEILIVLQGQAKVAMPQGEVAVRAGETWLLPASMPSVECAPSPSLGALIAHPH